MTITIKRMESDEEIEAKSQVHWKTWREAYDALLPADFQETMTLEKCRYFSYKYPENTLIAKDGEEIIGFVSYGAFRDENIQAGEIISMYILKDYYGEGIGDQLRQAALNELMDFQEVYLWVLAENRRAIAFYQKMKFVFDGAEKIIDLGGSFKEKRMVYRKNA